jgi:hypothetical protein
MKFIPSDTEKCVAFKRTDLSDPAAGTLEDLPWDQRECELSHSFDPAYLVEATRFTASSSFIGTVTYQYEANHQEKNIRAGPATVTIVVSTESQRNNAPVAFNLLFATAPGTPKDFVPDELRARLGYDPDGDFYGLRLVPGKLKPSDAGSVKEINCTEEAREPQKRTVRDCTLLYTPTKTDKKTFTGVAHFEFTLHDGAAASNSGTITVVVTDCQCAKPLKPTVLSTKCSFTRHPGSTAIQTFTLTHSAAGMCKPAAGSGLYFCHLRSLVSFKPTKGKVTIKGTAIIRYKNGTVLKNVEFTLTRSEDAAEVASLLADPRIPDNPKVEEVTKILSKCGKVDRMPKWELENLTDPVFKTGVQDWLGEQSSSFWKGAEIPNPEGFQEVVRVTAVTSVEVDAPEDLRGKVRCQVHCGPAPTVGTEISEADDPVFSCPP